MSKKIKLETRYGTKNYLEQYQGNTYVLKTESPYLRTGTSSTGKEFVDPSGGPMLIVGNKINNKTIISIGFIKDVGTIITLK